MTIYMFGDIAKAIRKVQADRKAGQKLLEKAYREMEAQLAYQEALDERARRSFTYGDMQDIVKVAQRVQVLIKFADGTTVSMKGTDPLDEYAQAMRKQGEYF